MKSSAQVVVIGGGVVGCSVLYHLAKMGWNDVVLVERQELTSGSSWHAAGGLFTVTRPNAVAAIHRYTFRIYAELEKETGQSCGFHLTGGLNLCRSKEEFESFKVMQSAVRRLGIECEFITLDEAKKKAPILETSPLYAAMWEVEGGHVDPASATQSFAAGARKLGAEIYRYNPVFETNPLPGNRWQVVTRDGTIDCDYVVNAAGLWGREVAALAGVALPLMPVEHHYLVTESVPEVQALENELPQINDGDNNAYVRQEGQGLLFGAYETPCRHWSIEATPQDFGHELLPDDLGRLEPHIAKAVEVMPCLATAGVKRVINGPMIFSPDLGPLLGPHPELVNYFCANGVMTGFNQGGGIGKIIAEWIIAGEPSFDISCWDVARFGNWATREFTKAATAYFFEHRSDRVYPHQEYDVGRPLRVPPVYNELKQSNAVFGSSFGLEHPLWFAPKGTPAIDRPSFRRPNWFPTVMDECKRVRNSVGVFEFSAMAKFMVEGDEALIWLNRVLANRIHGIPGRVTLSPMLSESGRLVGDFSVSCLTPERFLLLGTDSMQLSYMRRFRALLPSRGVIVRNVSDQLSGIHVAGPNAQSLLRKLADADLNTQSFPLLSASRMQIAGQPEVIVLRVSYTGETGYELYCNTSQQAVLFDVLRREGSTFDLGLVGTRCLMMMRLEKSFPAWRTELSPDYTPFEAGVGRFVGLNKTEFVGRSAALEAKSQGPREVLATLVVDAEDADAWGDEAIYRDGEVVGYVSSGGYGAYTGKSLALGYIRPDAISADASYAIEILGDKRPALLQAEPVYDPAGLRMRQ